MGTSSSINPLSEQILEIRFKAIPDILDKRGAWTGLFAAQLELPEWEIKDNRLDVFDKKNSEKVFVSHRNTGAEYLNAPTINYFPDKFTKFLKLLFNQDTFNNEIFIERIGVRYRFLTPVEIKFHEIHKKYINKMLGFNGKINIFSDANLIDTGASLNFSDKFGNFNTYSGVMGKEQAQQFFNREEDLPAVGLYFEIDYWIKPQILLDQKDIIRISTDFAKECWKRHDTFRRLIIEE